MLSTSRWIRREEGMAEGSSDRWSAGWIWLEKKSHEVAGGSGYVGRIGEACEEAQRLLFSSLEVDIVGAERVAAGEEHEQHHPQRVSIALEAVVRAVSRQHLWCRVLLRPTEQ